ncbi:hypothetical protein GCM10010277_13400 [Streptomyces longisporoflavus]|uniref:hypothetical protein n=1 Tax=Streptomyces longisporoflavus TaxID=28044 RepID=UPI00167C7C46|nr:hypothetical protein [Streptomyces longisporoflavus]GGV30092.1 hypothetical protein GCM10010277_13400 [Streptomyces longisporoflavus]
MGAAGALGTDTGEIGRQWRKEPDRDAGAPPSVRRPGAVVRFRRAARLRWPYNRRVPHVVCASIDSSASFAAARILTGEQLIGPADPFPVRRHDVRESDTR